MTWRAAKCLLTLKDQINAAYPTRIKTDDGILGDARHAAEHSEHNPDKNGVVRAIDISNDPAHGADSDEMAKAIVASRDRRILYMISQRRICSSVVKPWVWRPYSGTDPHVGHFHLSVVDDPALYDSTNPWSFGAPAVVQPKPPIAPDVPPPVPVAPSPGTPRAVKFIVSGKMSTFGGPHDTGMSKTEGLALFPDAGSMLKVGLGDYLVPAVGGASGLGRRLNTSSFYLACRWHAEDYPFLRTATVHVSNPSNGRSLAARAVDWGPNINTNRVADLSPGLAKALGLSTDQHCTVTVFEDGK